MLTAQSPPDFYRQLSDGEGFGNKVNALFQFAVVGNDIGSIAGHIEASDAGMNMFDTIGQLPAVHLGHDDIGE